MWKLCIGFIYYNFETYNVVRKMSGILAALHSFLFFYS
jgi:hypothetical protein